MLVKRIENFADLSPYQQRWDELAATCVFHSWAWLTTWWEHYGDKHELYVLLIFDNENVSAPCQITHNCEEATGDTGRLVGILPCYIENSVARGRVVRLLGDGEVCTDYLDLITASNNEHQVAKAVAEYLASNAMEWDATSFTAVGTDCAGLMALGEELTALDCRVRLTPNVGRWSLQLPADWDGLLAMQSKSHRKKLRRLERDVLATEQTNWHLVESGSDFEVAWPILVDLHQRRRISLGEKGCFASPRWASFHRDIARQLLDLGHLRLSWLELAGQPIAAEYQFANEHSTWAYQGGIEPDRTDEQPGRLSLARSIQYAISSGHQTFDLMRGDEPYKAQWRATAQQTVDMCVVAPRPAARWRANAFNYMQTAVRAARHVTSLLS
ncbi:MAG: GNAT family N-acetyltransferase [Planctomycetota bacterium]